MSNYIGVCHIHSTHSHDGRLSIEELARFFRERSHHFVCLTDHNPKGDGQFIGKDEMEAIVEECAAVSDEKFLIVPGLECETTDRTHILAIGITKPIPSKDWNTIIDSIHRQEGAAFIAHPFFFEREYSPEELEIVDGFEVWNSHTSLGIPDIAAVNLLKRMRRKGLAHSGLFSLDFHGPDDYGTWSLIISEEKLLVSTVIRALKTDGYLLRSPRFLLDPLPRFPFFDVCKWYVQGFSFYKTRKWGKQLQRKLEKIGITIPEFVLKFPRKFYYH